MDFIYLLRVLLKRKWIIIGAGLIAALTSGASLVSFGFGLNMIFIASAIGMWLGFDLYSTDKLHSPRKAMRSLEEERNAPPVKTSTPVVDNPQPEIKHSNNHVTTLIQKADPSYSPAPVRVPSPEPVAPSTPSAPSSPSVPQVSVTFEDTEPKKGPKIS